MSRERTRNASSYPDQCQLCDLDLSAAQRHADKHLVRGPCHLPTTQELKPLANGTRPTLIIGERGSVDREAGNRQPIRIARGYAADRDP